MKIINHGCYTSRGMEGYLVVVDGEDGFHYILQAQPDGCAFYIFTENKKQLVLRYDTKTAKRMIHHIKQQHIPEDVQHTLVKYLF